MTKICTHSTDCRIIYRLCLSSKRPETLNWSARLSMPSTFRLCLLRPYPRPINLIEFCIQIHFGTTPSNASMNASQIGVHCNPFLGLSAPVWSLMPPYKTLMPPQAKANVMLTRVGQHKTLCPDRRLSSVWDLECYTASYARNISWD